MRIFTRYILSEVTSHALLGGALFTFVLFMRDLGTILELVVRNSASLISVLQIFLFTLPNAFTVTIPMAVLVGVLLGLSRLAADSEITAMRAAGFGVFGFVRIVSIVAILAWLFGLVNTLYLAPRSAAALIQVRNGLKSTQASFEVQPRVFYEDFQNYVLYVQDVPRVGNGSSDWHRIFLADLSDSTTPRITTAESATVVNAGDGTLRMRLRNGAQHDIDPKDPNTYNVSTFAQTDLPIAIGNQEDTRTSRRESPILSMSNQELLRRSRLPGGKWYLIELHKRFAYPAACLVLMLVGIPIGLSSRRGGKSAGFVLTILLVFLYYFLSSTGVALARQEKLPVFIGVWAANLLFAAAGLLLLRQMTRGSVAFPDLTRLADSTSNFFNRILNRESAPGAAIDLDASAAEAPAPAPAASARKERRTKRFPLILDDYILREFLSTFCLVEISLVLLLLIFTFFDLLGDIIRNRSPFITVGAYLLNLAPSMIYTITPLTVLIAVLVTFGMLNRTNELTAMKATGISLYRVVAPILILSALLSGALYGFNEAYVPGANRRQEALRSVIKGKPAQTFLRPGREWMFGMQQAGTPGRIFYYQFFDPQRDQFANITVFEFNPDSFVLSRRISASSAHWEPQLHRWIFEKGWERSFSSITVSRYEAFDVRTFPELREGPSYFKKEALQSSEMSFPELSQYIGDLSQSGFNTMPLRVQLNRKLAYPLVTLVMAVIAVPFALSMGRRGSLTGVAVAVGVAISYWVAAGLFEAMGNVNTLPAILAAWSPDLLFAAAGGYLLLRTPT